MYYGKHFNVPVLGINTPLWINELTPNIINGIANQLKDLF